MAQNWLPLFQDSYEKKKKKDQYPAPEEGMLFYKHLF